MAYKYMNLPVKLHDLDVPGQHIIKVIQVNLLPGDSPFLIARKILHISDDPENGQPQPWFNMAGGKRYKAEDNGKFFYLPDALLSGKELMKWQRENQVAQQSKLVVHRRPGEHRVPHEGRDENRPRRPPSDPQPSRSAGAQAGATVMAHHPNSRGSTDRCHDPTGASVSCDLDAHRPWPPRCPCSR